MKVKLIIKTLVDEAFIKNRQNIYLVTFHH